MPPSSLNGHLFFLPPSPTALCGTFILTPQPAAPWRVGAGVSPIARCWRHLLNGRSNPWETGLVYIHFSMLASVCSAPTLPCLWSGRASSPYQTTPREPPAQSRLLPSCPSPPHPQSLASAPSCPCLPLWAFVSGLFWLPMPAFLSLSSLTGPVFSAAHGLFRGEASRGGSSCGRVGSLWRLLAAPRLQNVGPVGMAHGFSCFAACGLFPGRGSNLRPLHWERSSPLDPQGSPCRGHSAASTAPAVWRTRLLASICRRHPQPGPLCLAFVEDALS